MMLFAQLMGWWGWGITELGIAEWINTINGIVFAQYVMFAEGIVVEGVYILALFAGAGSIIGVLFKMLLVSKEKEFALLMAQKDKALLDLESQKKSYNEIAQEALKSAMDTANYYRHRDGKPPIIPIAPVVSESHSPSTAQQRETAVIATLRASMAQIKVLTGQEARPEQPQAIEPAVPASISVMPVAPELAEKPATAEDVKQGMIAVLKQSINEVPDRTADKVIDKLDKRDNDTSQE